MQIVSSYSSSASTHTVTLKKYDKFSAVIVVDGFELAAVRVAKASSATFGKGATMYRPEIELAWDDGASPHEVEHSDGQAFFWAVAL